MDHKTNFAPARDGVREGLESIVRHADLTCRVAVEGRLAARALVEWSRPLATSEPDFQVLWCLRAASDEAIDQATLASRLALSPAQVSNTVERLGRKGWICCMIAPGDRRRRLWRLTPVGKQTLDGILIEHGPPQFEGATGLVFSGPRIGQRKEVA